MGFKDWWQARKRWQKITIVVVGVFVLLGVVGAMGGGNQSPNASTGQHNVTDSGSTSSGPTSTQTSNTPSSSSPQQTGQSGLSVGIQSDSSHRDSVGYLHIVGEVKNTGTTNANYVQVTATVYDASGNVFATESTFATRNVMQPGDLSPFDVLVQDSNAQGVKYKLTVQPEPTTQSPVGGGLLTVQGTSSRVDSVGYEHVTGEVHNGASRTASFVQAVVTFYDASGKVVDTGTGYTSPSDVNAGATSPFDVLVNTNGVAFDHFTVFAQAQALK